MKISSALDLYEIRSFKVRYTLQSYCNLLKNVEKTSAFFVADSLYKDERISLTEQYLNQKLNVKIALVPKKINRLLFKFFKEVSLVNLLKGQIFVLEMATKTFFSKDVLKNITSSNKFFLRIIISQKKIYRKINCIQLLENLTKDPLSLIFKIWTLNISKILLIKSMKKIKI